MNDNMDERASRVLTRNDRQFHEQFVNVPFDNETVTVGHMGNLAYPLNVYDVYDVFDVSHNQWRHDDDRGLYRIQQYMLTAPFVTLFAMMAITLFNERAIDAAQSINVVVLIGIITLILLSSCVVGIIIGLLVVRPTQQDIHSIKRGIRVGYNTELRHRFEQLLTIRRPSHALLTEYNDLVRVVQRAQSCNEHVGESVQRDHVNALRSHVQRFDDLYHIERQRQSTNDSD